MGDAARLQSARSNKSIGAFDENAERTKQIVVKIIPNNPEMQARIMVFGSPEEYKATVAKILASKSARVEHISGSK